MKKLGLHDTLETERCIIKIPKESEAEYMWSLITDNTTKYMIWDKGETANESIKNIRETGEKAGKGKEWQAAIYKKETGTLIGRCGINKYHHDTKACELGYWISEEYYGKGIIPECVNRYLRYAFKESDYEKVIIRCDSKNINSARVAEKCGFIHEGTFKKHERIKGELRDTMFFGITKEEYLGY